MENNKEQLDRIEEKLNDLEDQLDSIQSLIVALNEKALDNL